MKKKILIYVFISILSFLLISCVDNTTTVLSSTSVESTSEISSEIEEFITISFNTGEEGSVINDIIIERGEMISLPVAEREGYSFLGWTLTDDELEEVIVSPFKPESSLVLYAKWIVNQYSISFEANGGSSIEPIVQDYLTSIVLPENPVREGHSFSGWYLDALLNTPFDLLTMPSRDITLYAKWEVIDWSDIEAYLDELIPDLLSEDISLPDSYLDYSISWQSSNPEIISDSGVYYRPYQLSIISLTAVIELGVHNLTKNYEIEVEGYKSLSSPITSSYIYRDYNLVTDSFFDTLDIINCAFITANSVGTLSGTSVLANINTYIMPKAREKGNWVIFSIAPDSDWSSIASNSTRINNFADNIVSLINQYGFDGVDIDWETPTDSESTRFTEMMRVIYTKVKENNPNHLVTAAIAGGMWQPPRYDLENSHQYIDYINMMTYGMVSNNGYYQNALYKSTVFDDLSNNVGKTLTSCSIEESIAIYNGYGILNSKIIVGVAFYGIKQTRTYDSNTQTWSSWSNGGSVSYTYINNGYLNNSNYTYHYDSNAGVPYIISLDGTTFISYDNPRSIREKSEYIIDNGLAGMMYWENGLDLTGALLATMDSELND
ncbi:MAG: glycosyl hydrolase family 18 protein [Candidatus Izemoplasmatales bacterium]